MERLERLFAQALELAPHERPRFLDTACGTDAALRAELEALLAADAHPPPLLDAAPEALSELLPDDDLPRFVGPYRILGQLGEGGMGVVLRAERTDIPKPVALKRIRDPFGRQALARFQREQDLLARLQHPNIAQLLDAGTDETGTPYFAMELVDGEPITTYCDRNRLGLEDRLRLFAEVCAAVQYAHRSLIVHRDLKPSNILVVPEGTGTGAAGQVKLLDFGIARLVEADTDAMQTQTGHRVLTPAYASPEQLRGEPVTTATDVYSLGVVLYELLTGHRPYAVEGKSAGELEQVVCEQVPTRPSAVISRAEPYTQEGHALTPQRVGHMRQSRPEALKRQLRGDLDNIVLMALRKEPDARYASVEALQADVQRYLEGLPVLAHEAGLGYRTRKFVQRHKTGVLVSAGVGLLVLGFAGVMTWQQAQMRQERDRAQHEAEKAQEVTGFLVDLFRSSDPSEVLGDTLTAFDMLAWGKQRAAALENQPMIQLALYKEMGTVYRSLGQYAEADTLLRKTIELQEQHLGPTHPDLIESLLEWANVYIDWGAYSQAIAPLERALALVEVPENATDEMRATVLNDLANTHFRLGDVKSSRMKLKASLGYRRNTYRRLHNTPGATDLQRAVAARDLAHNLWSLGQLVPADSLFEQAVFYYDRARPGDDAEKADALGDLGLVKMGLSQHEAAIEVLKRARAMRERLLGPAHPLAYKSKYELGYALMKQGRHAPAELLFTEVLAYHRQTLPPGHPQIAFVLERLARNYRLNNQLAEAETAYREALAINEVLIPPNPREVGNTLVGLGRTLSLQGQLDTAEGLLRAGIHVLSDVHESTSFRLLESKLWLGYNHQQMGQYAAADSLITGVYNTIVQQVGPETLGAKEAAKFVAGLQKAVENNISALE